MDTIWMWAGFNGFVLLMLALDLGVFHRHAHQVSAREAGTWTVIWLILALIFGGGVYYRMGSEAGLEFLTGYLLEKVTVQGVGGTAGAGEEILSCATPDSRTRRAA